ncbi:hypothetical protein GXP67_18280 [Rhodocytophaga rosea]|uniref:Uncharacterized protein n=1 Tax=Rhodocytophaga rosea TaxID=2704465 RepID=A0A6C0GLC9_9BACT|nr:hypothetical protein [Rhodocytophaga rosea]QHT68450.1 hypothetical protein GXP67_18280 [Rhodocytophaga rosea]
MKILYLIVFNYLAFNKDYFRLRYSTESTATDSACLCYIGVNTPTTVVFQYPFRHLSKLSRTGRK